MVYLVIGIVLFVAVGTLISQRSRHQSETSEVQPVLPGEGASTSAPASEAEVGDSVLLSPPTAAPPTIPEPSETKPAPPPAAPIPAPPSAPEEESIPLKPLLAAEPISSPSTLASATYSSAAPQALSSESPYGFGVSEETKLKSKPEPSLLRWSGRAGAIQVGELTLRGAVAYWSNGPSTTPEPSCIDITLPVEFSAEGADVFAAAEGASSYADMTPGQRGAYIRWLAGGRIQPPAHLSQPALWIFGLERRVLVDRLDVTMCIGEAFRLLPLLRWDALRLSLVKFITWMAAKAWLPEDQLMVFIRAIPQVPVEILNMLLRPYADAKLALPSLIAFTVMRASSIGMQNSGPAPSVPYSDELLTRFAAIYKSRCKGGIILTKPKHSAYVAYVPANPSLAGDKNAVGGVLELPDFFHDLTDFEPLVTAWRAFLKEVGPSLPQTSGAPQAEPPVTAIEEVEGRPDWPLFVQGLQGASPASSAGSEAENAPYDWNNPAVTDLGALANLMGLGGEEASGGIPEPEAEPAADRPRPPKPPASDRKKIADAARLEGFMLLPDPGISGKEYHWEDPVTVVPVEPGTKISQDFNAAALLLEYASALTSPAAPEEATEWRKRLEERMDEYFSLSSDDHARLRALSAVLGRHAATPENLGECLGFWLSREQRAVVRDLLTGLTAMPGLTEERLKDFSRAICTSLELARDDPPPLSGEEPGTPLPPLELGLKTAEVLAGLFKKD